MNLYAMKMQRKPELNITAIGTMYKKEPEKSKLAKNRTAVTTEGKIYPQAAS